MDILWSKKAAEKAEGYQTEVENDLLRSGRESWETARLDREKKFVVENGEFFARGNKICFRTY